MGAYLDKFAEANDGAEESTPTKITKLLHQKRLLALDPRSPSEGITRTPIIVEKTPAQQNGRFKLCSTEDETPKISRSFDRIKDPRSPTDAFTRTPINAGLLNTNRRLSPLVADFNSPASHHTETESGIESADVTPVMNIRHKLDETGNSQSPDSALSFDSWGQPFDIRHIQDEQNFEVDSLDPIMCEEEDHAEMEAIDVTSSPSIQSQLNTDVISTSARASLELPSVLTPQLASAATYHKAINTPKLSLLVKKTGPLIWSEGVVRSPLSTVDNSLIQRKTAGGKKLKHSGVIDKENVFH